MHKCTLRANGTDLFSGFQRGEKEHRESGFHTNITSWVKAACCLDRTKPGGKSQTIVHSSFSLLIAPGKWRQWVIHSNAQACDWLWGWIQQNRQWLCPVGYHTSLTDHWQMWILRQPQMLRWNRQIWIFAFRFRPWQGSCRMNHLGADSWLNKSYKLNGAILCCFHWLWR